MEWNLVILKIWCSFSCPFYEVVWFVVEVKSQTKQCSGGEITNKTKTKTQLAILCAYAANPQGRTMWEMPDSAGWCGGVPGVVSSCCKVASRNSLGGVMMNSCGGWCCEERKDIFFMDGLRMRKEIFLLEKIALVTYLAGAIFHSPTIFKSQSLKWIIEFHSENWWNKSDQPLPTFILVCDRS